ncbi:MAG: hypothetical protein GOMPHAMPRED_005266 [Gomphillus americanus]|uniref:Cytochrome b5 heme-binding domain-containing protein n=1 Tax=Gomphillus americanus TaxID=1940652 RepID=A0A8H3FTS1_9LECA|nr:MAG: hypothetical protein GOMPHAMPRED_005266 [Gomphillus americanus]
MVLLGISLIAASFCLFVYSFPPRKWLAYITMRLPSRSAAGLNTRREGPPQEKEDATRLIVENNGEFETSMKEIDEPSDDEAKTPKASPSDLIAENPVPLLNFLATETEDNDQSIKFQTAASISPKTSPAASSSSSPSAKKQSLTMQPPPRVPATSLMPPPAVKASALRPLPKLSGSLAPPPSAAASLRNNLKSTSNGLSIPASTSTLPTSKRPSRKVLLDPGHSPLDWANLIRNPKNSSLLRGAEVPPRLIKITPTQLKKQNGRKGMNAWGTYQGKVYNLTPYLKYHPGGVGELLRGAGKVGEAERLFVEIHPWVNWEAMLSECLVGILVSGDNIKAQDLEAMD